MSGLIETLRARGLIEAETSTDIEKVVEKPISVYCGFDPTAESLHLGNYVAIMGLAWFRRFGHTPVVIVGGATGSIGDPSGKSQERVLLSQEDTDRNARAIYGTIDTILGRTGGSQDVVMLNNRDWFQSMGFLDFLRDIGKHFRVGTMISRESVRTRLESEEGISYTEFSYQLLQSYDFYHLFKEHNVCCQLGGSDQWGNITAGIEFVRKKTGKEVWGLTFPLLVRSDGKKFGKSEKGAVWLSDSKLSVYDFYQYLYRVSDQDVIRLLKALTFIELDEIAVLEERMKTPSYVPNTAQKVLAEEVTRIVHGEEGLTIAHKITQKARPGQGEAEFSVESIEHMIGHVPCHSLPKEEVMEKRICDVIATCNFVKSRADVRRLIKNRGLSVNARKVEDELEVIGASDLVGEKYIVFSLGKKNRAILEIR